MEILIPKPRDPCPEPKLLPAGGGGALRDLPPTGTLVQLSPDPAAAGVKTKYCHQRRSTKR